MSRKFKTADYAATLEVTVRLGDCLPPDHLAREIRQAMPRLDLTALYGSYAGRGKTPHRPDLMLAIVLFELRRGQRKPSQWFQDTHENCALWWLGYGIRPARSGVGTSFASAPRPWSTR